MRAALAVALLALVAGCLTDGGTFKETITLYRPDGTVERVDETVIDAKVLAAGEAAVDAARMGVDYQGPDWALKFDKSSDAARAEGSELFRAAGEAFGAGINTALSGLTARSEPKPEPVAPAAPQALQDLKRLSTSIRPYLPPP